jgi:netrin-G3 ligand
VKLQWHPPEPKYQNGQIRTYEVTYFKWDESANHKNVNTTERFLNIENLQPDSNYVFQVKAFTSKGAGPWSNQLPFKTYSKSE